MPIDERNQDNRSKHPTSSQLTVYSRGEGAVSFRNAVSRHIQSCTECAASVETLQEGNEFSELSSGRVLPNSVAQSDAVDRPPELIDHPQYAVEREIGRGGMGIVYLVKHRLTGRHEALKVLMPSLVEREDVRIRFMREIQSAASLDHPNICRTLNAFNDGKVIGLVMEYLRGSDLLHFVRKHGPLAVPTACGIAIQLCDGLQHAHEKGMIHRDIKPGNLMVEKTPKGLRLKILDFGLARGMMEESSEQKSLTVDGRVLGTPEYMSPEQALTPSNVDIRSDLYSVGCVLYFMLSGKSPFQGETVFSILQAHISKQAKPLSEINPEIPTSLSQVMSALLEKDRNRRPNCPSDVVHLLLPFVSSTAATPVVLPSVPNKHNEEPSVEKPSDSISDTLKFPPRRPIRKKKQTSVAAKWLPVFLPTLLLLGVGYFFQTKILNALPWFKAPATSYIVLKNMPPEYEIWIDDQKTDFVRPAAGSPVQVIALPGTYKLTLKKQGKTKNELHVSIVAGRNCEITVPDAEMPDPVSPPPIVARNDGQPEVKPTVPAREPFPTSEEVSLAIETAKKAIRNRDGSAADAALAPMFNARGEPRLQELQPEFGLVRQLQKLAATLSVFNQKLASSIAKRTPNESVYIGPVRFTFLSSTQDEIGLQRNSEKMQFKATELPCEIEQCLLDLELDLEPQYNALIKAVGVFSHPKKTQSDLDLARKWIQAAVKAGFITDQFETIANEFATVTPDESAVPTPLRPYSLQRRLTGAEGSIEELFLLPPSVPYPKQTILLASVLGLRSHSGVAAPFWNVSTGTMQENKIVTSPLWACEVSANGQIFVTFGETSPQANLRVYGLKNVIMQPWFQASQLDDQRSAIKLSSDGRLLAACSSDEMFIRWNLQTKTVTSKIVSKAPIGRDKLAAVAIRPNSMDLVGTAAKDGSIRIWRTSDGSEASIAKDTPIAARAMQFNRKGDRLVIVRENGTIELRDLNLNLVESFRAHCARLDSIGFSMKGRYLVTADCYGNVRLWDTDELSVEAAFTADDSSAITALTADGDGDLVAIGHKDSTIELWSKK